MDSTDNSPNQTEPSTPGLDEHGGIRELMLEPEHDQAWLTRALQMAIKLEHATLPPYLCAMWSIKNTGDPVHDTIRKIVVDEMFHMGLACNLLTTIGGTPILHDPQFIPKYPGRLPGGVRPGQGDPRRQAAEAQRSREVGVHGRHDPLPGRVPDGHRTRRRVRSARFRRVRQALHVDAQGPRGCMGTRRGQHRSCSQVDVPTPRARARTHRERASPGARQLWAELRLPARLRPLRPLRSRCAAPQARSQVVASVRAAEITGLAGRLLTTLQAHSYRLPKELSSEYHRMRPMALKIFASEGAAQVNELTRLAAAEALGRAGDQRLIREAFRENLLPVPGAGILLAKCLVTVAEFSRFVHDGGYVRRRAAPATFTRKRHIELVAALAACRPYEALMKVAAPGEALELGPHELRQRTLTALLEAREKAREPSAPSTPAGG